MQFFEAHHHPRNKGSFFTVMGLFSKLKRIKLESHPSIPKMSKQFSNNITFIKDYSPFQARLKNNPFTLTYKEAAFWARAAASSDTRFRSCFHHLRPAGRHLD